MGDVVRFKISDEEMLQLASRDARRDGRKLETSAYTAMIALWYKENVARSDDSYELIDHNDGTGVHLYRPYDLTTEERDVILEWREKRRKEKELRAQMMEES